MVQIVLASLTYLFHSHHTLFQWMCALQANIIALMDIADVLGVVNGGKHVCVNVSFFPAALSCEHSRW